jgi:hypothetical protein
VTATTHRHHNTGGGFVFNDRISKSLRLKRKFNDSAFITVPAYINIPTASQFILWNRQNTD